jgi:hypothetical protein
MENKNRCCAGCKAAPSATVKLQRCTRCMSVEYCSKECQRAQWRSHKPNCQARSLDLPPGVSRTLPSKQSLKAGLNGGFRDVTVQEPKNVLACCWCCAKVLKVCGPKGTNPTGDQLGPFWTETYGRSDVGDSGHAEAGRTSPAYFVLGTPGSTGFYVACNQFNQSAACLYCARALQVDAEAHIRQCEAWLGDDKRRGLAAAHHLPDLSMAEQRIIARIALDQTPDLSHGPDSVAGYFTKQGDKHKMAVPYSFKDLEETAFPTLLIEASGFKGRTIDDLTHYTLMRLYSAEKMWRENSDYVVFSIHRLAAYNVTTAKTLLEQLPAPLPRERAGEIQALKISFLSEFGVDGRN